MLARLLWDPHQDTDALVREFISDFYGAAAPQVQEYFELCRSLVKDDTFMPCGFNAQHPIYTDDFIDKAWTILEKGKPLVEGDRELARRYDRVRLQILYLKEMRNPEESKTNGVKDEFLRIIADNPGIRINEGQATEDFLKRLP